MSTSFTHAGVLNYTAPGGAAGGESPATSVTAPNDSQEVGTVEIPAATGAAVAFVCPFGGIAVNARGFKIVNRTSNQQPIGIRLNGSSSDQFSLAPGGVFEWANPVNPSATLVTAVSFSTTAVQGATPGYVDYYAFGT